MIKNIFICITIIFSLKTQAQNQLNIVPVPVEARLKNGTTIFDAATSIYATSKATLKVAEQLNGFINSRYGQRFRITTKWVKRGSCITLVIDTSLKEKDAYSLQATDSRNVTINANSGAGLFYGVQTLMQLLPVKTIKKNNADFIESIPQVSITDFPRFLYRGMHLDVARHFSSVEFVKKYIDYLAMHKFNTFHWHLTDDQGWRIEIKKYPLLTQVGGCRAQTLVGPYGSNQYDGKKYCGFYTQEEIKEVVKYAADRYINIIPEIEMPGHALAALASYPYLGCTKGPYKAAETWGVFDEVFCAGNDSSFTFLQNVLDEVLELFPSKLIHIGGDESPKRRWKTCSDCQKRIATEKLKDEHELQSYFINRIEKYVNSKGRNIIGWDEILEGGLAPNATVMSWRGEEGGITAARQHHHVVMTPGNYLYFDHSQSNNEDSVTFGGYNSLEKVYSYEPIPAALTADESKYILGAQANLWTEYITNPKKVEYMLFPRIAALSEVLWSPKEKRNWAEFERRLPAYFDMLNAGKINYSKAFFDLKTALFPAEDHSGIMWKLESNIRNGRIVVSMPGIFIPKASLSKEDSTLLFNVKHTYRFTYQKAFRIDSSGFYRVILEDSTNILDRDLSEIEQKFSINKATGKRITITTAPSISYPGSGLFTLVDGVQNSVGMSKSSQFLGFSGDDLDATIDLGKNQSFSNITLHVFEQTASWIYRPQFVSFYTSENGKDFQLLGNSINKEEKRHLLYNFQKPVTARYIKVIAKNAGIIKDGEPGAGNKAWLFVDEIEVN
ncbi:MAG: family 20 glycosylhydrolase [Rhizobacter sp.]|nr:family 20 glycosylhydrolase [Ferruginibacter sp.]